MVNTQTEQPDVVTSQLILQTRQFLHVHLLLIINIINRLIKDIYKF